MYVQCAYWWDLQPAWPAKLWISVSSLENHKEEDIEVELVSEELNHLAAILHVYAGGLIFMK